MIADPHVALGRREEIVWHHRLHLDDAHARLAAALAHPLVAGSDVVAVLGDLSHFGDAASVAHVVDAVAAAGGPTVLLAGNHDVFEAEVRLATLVSAAGAPAIWNPIAGGDADRHLSSLFTGAGLGARAWEVVGRAPGGRPFAAACADLVTVDDGPVVTFTHFPVLDIGERCDRHGLRYAGSLETLADHQPPPAARPEVVLAGHLHLRSHDIRGHLLQLCFASLVEAPFEIGCVVVDHDVASGSVAVEVVCDTVGGPVVDDPPLLEADRVRFVWEPGRDSWLRPAGEPG
ncbi:MAG: metallophosphoesterase [Actinomycetota bacterium]|nr:metallophosphoesterase [Actinomycetota bacterium]